MFQITKKNEKHHLPDNTQENTIKRVDLSKVSHRASSESKVTKRATQEPQIQS